MKVQQDVSGYFSDCIGSRIVRFAVDDFIFKKASNNYHQSIFLIGLDNGKTIRISLNFGEVEREETSAYFDIV